MQFAEADLDGSLASARVSPTSRTTDPPDDVPHIISYEQRTGLVYDDADRPAQASPLSLTNPVSMSSGGPDGLPFSNGTKSTL
jgi:hypothetical protein